MTYSGQFHRLVIMGDLYSDTFNVTLAFAPTPGPSIAAVTAPLLTGIATVIGDWWDNPLAASPGNGLTISGAARLTGIKLNRIGEDGRYVDPDTMEHTYTTAIPGGGSAGSIPQVSLVSTLRGPDERGKAGKGRMYWPPSQAATGTLDTTGRVGTTVAQQHAYGVKNLLTLLNAAYVTAGVPAVAAIASRAGTGRFQVVTKVTVGRVVDTMRSRRNKLLEDPVEVSM